MVAYLKFIRECAANVRKRKQMRKQAKAIAKIAHDEKLIEEFIRDGIKNTNEGK